MKTIILLRHAKARHHHAGEADFDRRLSNSGREMARETAEQFKSLNFEIDRVICSSAVRTRETAEIVTSIACPSASSVWLDDLYLAPAERFASSVCHQAFPNESSVLVIGHNPGLAELICRWAGEGLAVPTSTLAVFEFSTNDWSNLRLNSAVTPKLICLIQEGRITRQEPSSAVSMKRAHE